MGLWSPRKQTTESQSMRALCAVSKHKQFHVGDNSVDECAQKVFENCQIVTEKSIPLFTQSTGRQFRTQNAALKLKRKRRNNWCMQYAASMRNCFCCDLRLFTFLEYIYTNLSGWMSAALGV